MFLPDILGMLHCRDLIPIRSLLAVSLVVCLGLVGWEEGGDVVCT